MGALGMGGGKGGRALHFLRGRRLSHDPRGVVRRTDGAPKNSCRYARQPNSLDWGPIWNPPRGRKLSEAPPQKIFVATGEALHGAPSVGGGAPSGTRPPARPPARRPPPARPPPAARPPARPPPCRYWRSTAWGHGGPLPLRGRGK